MNLSADGLAELEVGFLDQLLPLFQTSHAVPRADVDVVRVGTHHRFFDYLFYGDVGLIHLSSHGTTKSMQIGGVKGLKPVDLRRYFNEQASGPIDAVVVNTSCEMASEAWVKAFLDVGAVAYIATKRSVWAKDAAIFSSAFYSSYFGTIHIRKTALQRAFDSYRVAHAAYCSFVPGASRSRFYFKSLQRPNGRANLPPIKLA